MNLYFNDMKNIDVLQTAQRTVNTYILLRKNLWNPKRLINYNITIQLICRCSICNQGD